MGLDLEDIVADGQRMGTWEGDRPGLVRSLEAGSQADGWQRRRPEPWECEEEAVQRATWAWGQPDEGKRKFEP